MKGWVKVGTRSDILPGEFKVVWMVTPPSLFTISMARSMPSKTSARTMAASLPVAKSMALRWNARDTVRALTCVRAPLPNRPRMSRSRVFP